MNKIINRTIIAVLIINAFLLFNMSNIMIGQSAKIQMLKQSNVEQQEEKEFYRSMYEKMEDK